MLLVLHLVLKVSLRLILIQRGVLSPLRLLPLMRVLCLCIFSAQHQRTAGLGAFFEGLQNYIQIKNEGNENKIILGDLNCNIDKTVKYGENKTQRFYRCWSSYTLSKLVVDNGLEDLWRRENSDFPEFTCYDRSFTKDPGQTGSILI